MIRYFVTATLSLGASLIALLVANQVHSRALQSAAAAILTAGVVLPLLYLALALGSSRQRRDLARFFARVMQVSLIVLVGFLAAQALLLVSGALLLSAAEPGNRALWLLLLLAAAQLCVALLLVASWQRLLEVEPLTITGVVVEADRAPRLLRRIEALVDRLGAAPLTRVIVGLEPTAFATNTTINLRGSGVLPPGTTLYLPAIALRALSDAELDAIIGHELGHFRGDDLRYTERFVPAIAGLLASLESLNLEERGASGLLRLLRLPGLTLIGAMLQVFQHAMHRIDPRRELEADQAALEVAAAPSVVSALIKMIVFGVQWSAFRHGNSLLVNTGVARRNLVLDYLTRTAHLLAAMEPWNLHNYILGTRLAHPFDTHPTLAERADALGVDAETAIDRCLPEITWAFVNDEFRELEEEVSLAEAEHARSPGVRLSLDQREELPLSLDLPPIPHRRSG